MRKKLFAITALIILSLLLTSCHRATYKITVSDKAKTKITLEEAVTADFYSSDSDKELTPKQIYAKLKKDIKKDHKKYKKRLKFKKTKKTIKGEKYYGYVVTGIKKIDNDKCYKKNGRIYYVIDATAEDDTYDEEFSKEDMKTMLEIMEASGMSSKYVITFPHKPKTSYGKVKGKTVTVNLLKYIKKHPEGGKIVISCKK